MLLRLALRLALHVPYDLVGPWAVRVLICELPQSRLCTRTEKDGTRQSLLHVFFEHQNLHVHFSAPTVVVS